MSVPELLGLLRSGNPIPSHLQGSVHALRHALGEDEEPPSSDATPMEVQPKDAPSAPSAPGTAGALQDGAVLKSVTTLDARGCEIRETWDRNGMVTRHEVVDVFILRPEAPPARPKRGHVPGDPTVKDVSIITPKPERRHLVLASYVNRDISYSFAAADIANRKKVQSKRDAEVVRVKKHLLRGFLSERAAARRKAATSAAPGPPAVLLPHSAVPELVGAVRSVPAHHAAVSSGPPGAWLPGRHLAVASGMAALPLGGVGPGGFAQPWGFQASTAQPVAPQSRANVGVLARRERSSGTSSANTGSRMDGSAVTASTAHQSGGSTDTGRAHHPGYASDHFRRHEPAPQAWPATSAGFVRADPGMQASWGPPPGYASQPSWQMHSLPTPMWHAVPQQGQARLYAPPGDMGMAAAGGLSDTPSLSLQHRDGGSRAQSGSSARQLTGLPQAQVPHRFAPPPAQGGDDGGSSYHEMSGELGAAALSGQSVARQGMLAGMEVGAGSAADADAMGYQHSGFSIGMGERPAADVGTFLSGRSAAASPSAPPAKASPAAASAWPSRSASAQPAAVRQPEPVARAIGMPAAAVAARTAAAAAASLEASSSVSRSETAAGGATAASSSAGAHEPAAERAGRTDPQHLTAMAAGWQPPGDVDEAADNVLRAWLFSPAHIVCPYPTMAELLDLEAETGLAARSLERWFAMARPRLWAPVVRSVVGIPDAGAVVGSDAFAGPSPVPANDGNSSSGQVPRPDSAFNERAIAAATARRRRRRMDRHRMVEDAVTGGLKPAAAAAQAIHGAVSADGGSPALAAADAPHASAAASSSSAAAAAHKRAGAATTAGEAGISVSAAAALKIATDKLRGAASGDDAGRRPATMAQGAPSSSGASSTGDNSVDGNAGSMDNASNESAGSSSGGGRQGGAAAANADSRSRSDHNSPTESEASGEVLQAGAKLPAASGPEPCRTAAPADSAALLVKAAASAMGAPQRHPAAAQGSAAATAPGLLPAPGAGMSSLSRRLLGAPAAPAVPAFRPPPTRHGLQAAEYNKLAKRYADAVAGSIGSSDFSWTGNDRSQGGGSSCNSGGGSRTTGGSSSSAAAMRHAKKRAGKRSRQASAADDSTADNALGFPDARRPRT